MSYRLGRIIFGLFGYLFVKVNVMIRSYEDYHNGDVWWSFLGLGCLVLPSIPVALKYLQKNIKEINMREDPGRVKSFFKLLFFTVVYILGGFILFAIGRIVFKLYCTCQNIKDPLGKNNQRRFRRKEIELNLMQATVESAPDGLLKVILH